MDEAAVQMKEIKESGLVTGGEAVVKELQKRKLIQPKYVIHSVLRKGHTSLTFYRKYIHYSISKGPQFSTEVKQLETDLTVEMLQS